jgi:hypothetical protein
MKIITIHATSIKKLIRKIDENLENGALPTLSFIYASPLFNIKKLTNKLSKYDFMIMGATTAGELYANQVEGVHEFEGEIVCMLIDINPDALALTVVEVKEDAYIIGEHIGLWAKSHFSDASIITLTSGLTFDNDAYTQGIVSKGVEYVFGGAAGDNFKLKETLVFSNNMVSNQGVLALAIDKTKIDVVGSRAFGWGGIGKERIVTKSVKNVVYEIDGMPAINFYQRYLNIDTKDIPQRGLEYPLEVRRRNGQVVYRAVLAINEEQGSLIFAGHVEEKARVRISAAKGKSIIKNVEKSNQEILSKNPNFKPQLALLFPCCSRKQVLGHFAYLEVEAVIKSANVPLVGFFAYGEIGAFPGSYGFHNETFVTVFLEEKAI